MVKKFFTKGENLSLEVITRLKEDLVNEGLVTKDNLRTAEIKAQNDNESLGNSLIKLGFLTEEQLTKFIGDKIHIPYVNIQNYTIDRKVLELIPEKIARKHNIIPLFRIEDVLTIAINDPLDIFAIDEIASLLSKKGRFYVEALIAPEENIRVAIDQWYGVGGVKTIIEELTEEFKEIELEDKSQYNTEINTLNLQRKASKVPMIVNSYIAQAILEGASDIHLEPKDDAMVVRFRIDGYLYTRDRISAELIPPIISRVKIMSGLDIANSRVPQDGRMGLVIGNKNIDIRTSTMPAMYGENVVLRILDKSKGVPSLSELGFSAEDIITFKNVIRATKGIILATGPTGSGKTTTICSTINAIPKEDKNIMTIEDPIEYRIEGIVQSQVNPVAGVTFASALKSILRQDPNIIYVGEIRDLETAEISVRAALTGHLVFSTLHTNDAVGVITRLKDIGIETGLISDVLNCSFAQRLVRQLCPRCKKKYQPDEGLLQKMGIYSAVSFYKRVGCDFCSGIGYKGRVGIFEILVVNRDIRVLIEKNASEDEIREALKKQGVKTLYEDGLSKVMNGITTLEELEKIIIEEKSSEKAPLNGE
jgi:type IV pilus assembly protein PilB